MRYFVTGSTGQVGSVVVSSLRAQNLPTHCLVHTPSKAEALQAQGCTTTIGDVNNLDQLIEALTPPPNDPTQKSTVFFLHPENFQHESLVKEAKKTAQTFVTALQKVPSVSRIIFLSTLGGDIPTNTGFLRSSHEIESVLTSSLSIPTLMIRAGYFFENWIFPIKSVAAGETDTLQSIIPDEIVDQPMAMVAALDIGSYVAEWMRREDWGNTKVIQVVGPSEYSARNVADVVGRVVGREVDVRSLGEEGIRGMGKSMGWSEGSIEAWIETSECFKKGLIVPPVEGEGKIVVRGEVAFEEFCRNILAK
ncbi:hypothetical protein HDV00_008681 [Rhizophlyctis rosea]|nr:hypothetical protein HDV00_008681 [Rhizophlyctis rosea]